MGRPTLTYELAMAASRDAGNRSMRAAGRTQWSEDDWNASVAEFERLWPSAAEFTAALAEAGRGKV